MSAIFLSHSSQDEGSAADLARRLRDQGYTSFFLDFDPACGIPAGRNWEQELYRHLRTCRAVIVLCSDYSMRSDWCFAEITHAKALGKRLFPLKIAPCTIRSTLTDLQVIDLSGNPEEGYRRLWQGLRLAGLDPKELFHWGSERPPYPGLMAFQEADAAIFFGRDADIRAGLDLLNRLRRFGGANLLLVVGASGSGKSSLVRAGLLPRLKRDEASFLVSAPFRPLDRPFDELALALAETFARYDIHRDWRDLRKQFCESVATPELMCSKWRDLIRDLRHAAGQRCATVLVVVDQLEELLGRSRPEGTQDFLAFLCAGLRTAAESRDTPLLMVVTLRSDFLSQFQNHALLRQEPFEDLPVGPLGMDGFAEVIEGPARVAGLELEQGLMPRMVADVKTEQALPLLAFTLRELWEQFGQDGVLSIVEYRDRLGGLEGSLERAAEALLTASRPSAQQVAALRKTFRSMVRISESGQYVRQPVPWSALPTESHEILERFVDARLLVSDIREGAGEPTLEVAHEALFHAWGTLKGWLDEDLEFLIWRQRLHFSATDWKRSGRDRAALLRGGLLSEALRWLTDRGNELGPMDREFILASRQRDRLQRRTRYFAGGIAVLATLAAASWIYWSGRESLRQARRVYASSVTSLAARSDPLLGALLLSELQGMPEPVGGLVTAQKIAQTQRTVAVLHGHDAAITSVEFSPDGSHIVTASADRTARVWQADGRGEPVILRGHTDAVTLATFSPDGSRVATSSADGTARIWRVDGSGQAIVLRGHDGPVTSIAFDRSGLWVATSAKDGTARLWRTDRSDAPRTIDHVGKDDLGNVVFLPDGRHLATGGEDGRVKIWDLDNMSEPAAVMGEVSQEPVVSLHLSRDGSRLAVTTGRRLVIWQIEHGWTSSVLVAEDHGGDGFDAALTPDGKRLLSYGSGPTFVWDLAKLPIQKPSRLAENEPPAFGRNSLVVSPTGSLVAYGTNSYTSPGRSKLWRVTDDGLTDATALPAYADTFAFSRDGALIVAGAQDGTAYVWHVDNTGEPAMLPGGFSEAASYAKPDPREPVGPVFSRDGSRLAYVSKWKDKDGVHAIRVVSTDNLSRQFEFAGNQYDFVAMDFSPDGRILAAGSVDGTARVWQLDGGEAPIVLSGPPGRSASPAEAAADKYLAEVLGEPADSEDGEQSASIAAGQQAEYNPVSCVAVSTDGKHVLLGFENGTGEIWRIDGTGTPTLLRGLEGPIVAARYSGNGSAITLVSIQGAVGRWRADGGHSLSTFNTGTELVGASISPDGSRILTVSRDKHFYVWLSDGTLLWDASLEGPLALSPDLRLVAVRFEDSIRLWPIADPEAAVFLRGNSPEVGALSFSPDGERIATSWKDGTVRIWHSNGSGDALVLQAADASFFAPRVLFSPDGQHLLTATELGLAGLKLWRVDWEQLIVFLRASMTVCLEPADRIHYLSETPDQAQAAYRACEQDFGRASTSTTEATRLANRVAASELERQARNLAEALRIDEAIAQFREVLRIDPARNFDPVEQAHIYAAAQYRKNGDELARSGQIDEAVAAYQIASQLHPPPNAIDAGKQAQRLAAPWFGREGGRLIGQGNIAEGLSYLDKAEQYAPGHRLLAECWNHACWQGALHGQPQLVQDACRRAVELQPGSARIRDSRGLVRAMNGDFGGAIADFEAYVDSLSTQARYEEKLALRRSWIEQLRQGRNPITQDVLDALRESSRDNAGRDCEGYSQH